MNWLVALFLPVAVLYLLAWLIVRRRVGETAVAPQVQPQAQPTPDNPHTLPNANPDCGICDAKWDKIVGGAR